MAGPQVIGADGEVIVHPGLGKPRKTSSALDNVATWAPLPRTFGLMTPSTQVESRTVTRENHVEGSDALLCNMAG